MRNIMWATVITISLGLSVFFITGTGAQEVSLSGQFVTEPVRGIELSWVAPSDMRIAIQRRLGDTFITVGPFARTRYQVYDTNIVARQTYTYRIKAIDPATGNEYFSNTVSIVAGSLDEGGDTETPIGSSQSAPAAPTDLQADLIEEPLRAIRLSWIDQADNEAGFTLERLLNGVWTAIDSLQANQRSAFDTTFVAGETYQYRLRAENSVGVSSYAVSEEVIIPSTALPEVPNTPTSVQAVVDGYSVVLMWDDVEGEEEFVIERRERGLEDSSYSDFEELVTVSRDQVRFVDTNIAQQTRYIYRVVARNSVGDSRYSSAARVRTNSFAPARPEQPTISVSPEIPSIVTLTWPIIDSAETVTVERREHNRLVGWSDFEVLGSVRADLGSFVDNSIEGSARYQYRIQGINTYGSSAWSRGVVARIHSYAPDRVESVTANLTSTFPPRVQLEWSSSAEATGYTIERRDRVFGSFVEVAQITGTSWTDTAVESNERYRYRVIARNDYDEARPSRATAIRLPSFAPDQPEQPTLYFMNSLNPEVTLQWQPVEHASAYSIQRRDRVFDSFVEVARVQQVSWVDSDLQSRERYRYRVIAVNEYGESRPSRAVAIRLPSFAPDRPERPELSLNQQNDSYSITIDWQEVDRSTGYIIERRNRFFDLTYSEYARVEQTTQFTDTEIEYDGRYYYRIRAYNQYDQSRPSPGKGIRVR